MGLGQTEVGLGWELAGAAFPETILGGSLVGDRAFGAGGKGQRFAEELGRKAVGA